MTKLKWYKPAWSETFGWWLCWPDGAKVFMAYTLPEAEIESRKYKSIMTGAAQPGDDKPEGK